MAIHICEFTSFFQGFNCKCSRDIVLVLVTLFFPWCDICLIFLKEIMSKIVYLLLNPYLKVLYMPRILNSKLCGLGGSMRALSRSGPGFDPRSGQVSWVRFFSGLFLTCKTNFRKLQAPRFPNIIWPSLSSLMIHYWRQCPEMLTLPKTSNIHTYSEQKNFECFSSKLHAHGTY